MPAPSRPRIPTATPIPIPDFALAESEGGDDGDCVVEAAAAVEILVGLAELTGAAVEVREAADDVIDVIARVSGTVTASS